MAKKPNPFAKFEQSGKDVEVKGKGKEGSKKEEAFDKKQAKPFEKSKKDTEPSAMKEGSKKEEALDKKQARGYACGGKVKGMATGGSVRGTGAAQRGTGFKSGQS